MKALLLNLTHLVLFQKVDEDEDDDDTDLDEESGRKSDEVKAEEPSEDVGEEESKDKPTKKEKRNVYSTAYDIMYVVSNGNIKTPKHLQMGIGLKSLTGSKKVVTIANKLGHSIAYSQS